MADNNLETMIPQLLAQGLMALRENAKMPLLVNREYDELAGPEGSTINVPVPSAIQVQTVTPAATPPSTEGVIPATVAIELDQWKEAPFYLTDKDMLEIQRGSLPKIASEAIRSLANEVDQFLLNLGKKFYGVYGTAGTTPFASDVTAATQVRKVLNKQLAPLDPRVLVFDPDCEANMLALRAFHDASFGVGGGAILAGDIGPKLGFLNIMDQNVRLHTAGTGTDWVTNSGSTATSFAVGTKTIVVTGGSGTILVGDIVKFANHTQTYVVTTALSGGSFAIEPGLVVAVPDATAVLAPGDTGGIGSHVMNLAFHRDAIAFATRPLAGSNHPGSIIDSAFDEVSGLTLRLEMTREFKRDRFSFDVLYGGNVIRRELGARLLG